MKSVCSECDLGLKRSDCSDYDYISCECRRWLVKFIKTYGVENFVKHVFDEALDTVFEDIKSVDNFRNAKNQEFIKMMVAASKELSNE